LKRSWTTVPICHASTKVVNFKRRGKGVPVRVVVYTIDDPGRPQAKDRYRLLTTILDPEAAPADELARLYDQRWEFESLLDELKTHQRGARVVLRSKLPDGVLQELYGMLCVHHAIRWLMHTVALEVDGCGPGPPELHPQSPGGAAHHDLASGFFPLRSLRLPSPKPLKRSSLRSSRRDGCGPTPASSSARCRTMR
jgi:hypothetical protein